MTVTHRIETGTSAVTGNPWWTVVQYVDDMPQGGDHHWVRERYAERAYRLYGFDFNLHGKPSGDLAKVYAQLHKGAAMFDKD